MSEHRIADRKITIALPRVQGKIQHDNVPITTIRLYGAYQFRKNHRRLDRNFSPRMQIKPHLKERYYSTMYRIKFDGKWYRPGKCRYCFFSMDEVSNIICQLMT